MQSDEVVGLIPCGGQAKRIAPLPCSKELLPIGLRRTADGSSRPKVVSHSLLEKMRQGGVRKVFFILRSGKWDIPQYYGDGSGIGLGLDIAYLIVGRSDGPPYTLDQAYPFVTNARVAFGFPDILFQPADAYEQALRRLTKTRAAIVLGLYPAHKKWPWHAVVTDRKGRVQEILMNRSRTKLGWVFAVWTSRFTEFLHEFLAARKREPELVSELTVGEAIQAAVQAGLPAQSVVFSHRNYLDIGTPEDLQRIATGGWSEIP